MLIREQAPFHTLAVTVPVSMAEHVPKAQGKLVAELGIQAFDH